MGLRSFIDPVQEILARLRARMPQAFRTLKFRLMLLITAVLLLVVGLPVALFVQRLDRNYHEFSTTMLEITTGFVYQHLVENFMENDSAAIQQNVELLARDPRIRLLRILEPGGTILYSSLPAEIRQNVLDLPADRSPSGSEAFTRMGDAYMHHHPIYAEPGCTNCHEAEGAVLGTLDIVASFVDSEYIYTFAKHLSITGGIGIILILWFSSNLLYQGQIESRLRTILGGFDELARGNYDHKIEMSGRHELALMAERFNKMVETLDAAKRREEGFYQEKLERADRLVTLGEIAAEIAHEVNNPAGIIRTRAEFVHDEIETSEPDSPHLDDLRIVVQQTERIADITHSILHYARKPAHSFASTDLQAVIRHSLKILQPRIKKSNVDVELRLGVEPAIIWGSFSQLEQVFCNLVNNSLDAMAHGPGAISVSLNNGADRYRVVFEDTGPGVPDGCRQEIFSPFFTTKHDGKGTGLGLFIARNIVVNHRGSLSLASENGSGACFSIEFERHHGSA
jgi:signal transduction histidine kinase